MIVDINFWELSDSEKKVYEYMQKFPEKVSKLSGELLAKEVYVSKPTVYRVCKKMGFSSFSEYKYFLIKNQQESLKLENPTLKMVEHLLGEFDNDFSEECVKMFENINVVIVYATQASTIAASFLSRQLTNLGYFTKIVQDEYEFKEITRSMPEKSIVVAISNTGENNLINARLLSVTNKVPIFTITKKGSSLSRIADSGLFHDFDICATSSSIDRENQMPMIIIIHEFVERIWLNSKKIKHRD